MPSFNTFRGLTRQQTRTDLRSRRSGNFVEVNRKKLDALGPEFRLRMRDAVSKTVNDIHAETLIIIREKNLIDTGNLLNSVFSYTTLDGLTGYIEVGAFYGIYLEFGTLYMAARPFLGPAVERKAPEFIKAIRVAARDVVGDLRLVRVSTS